MKRRIVASLILVVTCLCHVQAASPQEKKATLVWVQSLQTKSGGFVADNSPDAPASLPATAAALLALKYIGGEVKNKEACREFVVSCYDIERAGFAPSPGGKPDVVTTALGTLACAELNLLRCSTEPKRELSINRDSLIRFLFAHSKSFEEIRISAAALESVEFAAEAKEWIDRIRTLRNPDGTFGKRGYVARDTAAAAVTILRLNGTLETREQETVVNTIKVSEKSDGGWGADTKESSDLATTYRVMRAFHVLKERPDTTACKTFVAKCRNKNGGYGMRPGQPSTVTATYFAGAILHWLEDAK